MIKYLTLIAFLVICLPDASAQIRPPGYEREVAAMEARRQTSVLEKDSVMVYDTIVLFDPVTYRDTMKFVSSQLAWKDYLMFRLGINEPEKLLNGEPMTIMDPGTYEEITIRWNASATKLDTIQQH